jgi:hypothetical protein
MTASAPKPNNDDLELLSAYIDQQLTAGERAQLEQRLAREAGLRRDLSELRETVSALKNLEPARPPRSFTLDTAKAQELRGPQGWRAWLPVMQAGGALATLVLLIVAWAALGMNSGGVAGGSTAAELAVAPTAEQPFTMSNQAPSGAAGAVPAATAAPAATTAPEATAAPAAESAISAADTTAPSVAPPAAAPLPAEAPGIAGQAAAPTVAIEHTTAPTAPPAVAREIATSEVAGPQTTDLNRAGQEKTAQAQPSATSIGVWIGLGVLVIALVVGAGVLVARRRR